MEGIKTKQITTEDGPIQYQMTYGDTDYLCTQISKTKWEALDSEFKTLKEIKQAILKLPAKESEPVFEGTFDCVDPNALLLLLFVGDPGLDFEIRRTLAANGWMGPNDTEMNIEEARRVLEKFKKND